MGEFRPFAFHDFAHFIRDKGRTDRSNPGRHITRGNPASHYRTIRSFEFPMPARVAWRHAIRKGDHDALPWYRREGDGLSTTRAWLGGWRWRLGGARRLVCRIEECQFG